jgi:hypothetical protein
MLPDPFFSDFLPLPAPVPVRPGDLVVIRWGLVDPVPDRQYLVMATRRTGRWTWEADLLTDPEPLP